MKKLSLLIGLIMLFAKIGQLNAQDLIPQVDEISYPIYPETVNIFPDLLSPCRTVDGQEYVVAITNEDKFAIILVALSYDRNICKQLVVDTIDFPYLVQHGIHQNQYLDTIRTITGRTISEITELGLPGALSGSGFLAENEDIVSVIRRDNQLVCRMGFTHPQLAKPLFHVLNMMDMDLSLNRWNMAMHRWDNIKGFYYNGRLISVEAFDTKGGQLSIFNDSLEGAFHIKLWREPDKEELNYLNQHYGHLPAEEMKKLQELLSFINTGELEPQYIMRYGFYEGHTFWRTDPIAIAFLFGLKSLIELDSIFDHKLDVYLFGLYSE